jgi:nicotinate-nucleotide--dimethylbenzimidazole phosphoribosyltransferase
MELFESIIARRDTRHFTADEVPENILQKAFYAAQHSPSVGLSEPTKFHLIRKYEIKKQIFDLFVKADVKVKNNISQQEQLDKYEQLKLQAILDSPLGMIVTTDYSVLKKFTIGVSGNAHALQWSSVCAIQNFWLSLTEDGYSMGWVSILDYYHLNQLLGLPNHEVALGYFCIGKPATHYNSQPMLQQLGWRKARVKTNVCEITELNSLSDKIAATDFQSTILKNNQFLNYAKWASQKWNELMLPEKSLGKLEQAVITICGIQQSIEPDISKAHALLFVADHGIAQTGLVNQYPQSVTLQLMNHYAREIGAINFLCKANQIELDIINCGVNGIIQEDLIINNYYDYSSGMGTRNYLEEPAMNRDQLDQCFENGKIIVQQKLEKGCNFLLLGESGIGNTSAASLLMASLLKIELADCIGNGAGQSSEGLEQKKEILQKVFETYYPKSMEESLCCFGGFEIATMTAAYLEAYEQRIPVLVDGFIAAVALLCAEKINNCVTDNCLFSHQGKEQGHQLLLRHFKAEPLLNLDLALGEGSGSALAYPLVKNAVILFNQIEKF